MAELTSEQLEQLPSVLARATVELRAIHIHTNLPGSPASIETDEGRFRLSPALSRLAAKAYAARADTRPKRGRLGFVLAAMAGTEYTPSEPEEDPLAGLAASLARDAMSRLEDLVQKAVVRGFAQRRDSLVAEALRSIVG